MSVHIRYRFLKEKGDYLKDPEKTRGYTMVEANRDQPYYEVLKDFYKDFKGRGVQTVSYTHLTLPTTPYV